MQEFYKRSDILSKELEVLEIKVIAKTNEWNAIAEFLRRQGIKPNATNIPLFSELFSHN
ncbi:hypothetical protein [Microseira sp. BLCC-F43]|jgi:hypothetical protein|uniref:hypothetical protein n=1 Tax=Microseira sp. BLCC-F43 TaxID=3153602 RepID=UPI0035B82ED9